MLCTSCNSPTSVLDTRTRATDGGVRRRRQCKSCGRRFTSVEYPQDAWLPELPDVHHEADGGGPLEAVRRRALIESARDENEREWRKVAERMLETQEQMLRLAEQFGLTEKEEVR